MAQEIFKNKELPFSIEAEKAVLGGIMLKNEAWDLVHVVIREDDFYKDEHKLIFKTIYNLQDQGKPVDVITVQEAIEGNGDLPKLINSGGYPINNKTKPNPKRINLITTICRFNFSKKLFTNFSWC